MTPIPTGCPVGGNGDADWSGCCGHAVAVCPHGRERTGAWWHIAPDSTGIRRIGCQPHAVGADEELRLHHGLMKSLS